MTKYWEHGKGKVSILHFIAEESWFYQDLEKIRSIRLSNLLQYYQINFILKLA